MNRTFSSFIWHFVRPHRWVFFVILLVSLVWSLDATIWPYLLKVVIDVLTRFDADRGAVWSALKFPIFWGLLLWVGVEIGFRCQGFLLAKTIPKLESDIRMAMFDHVQHHSPKYFSDHFSGNLVNKITDMTTQVTLILQQVLTVFIPAVASCVLGVFFFLKLNAVVAIILGIWILAHFAICIVCSRKCDKYESAHSEVRSTLLGKIVDSLTNNFAVNLFYRFSHENAHIAHYQKEEIAKNVQAKRYVEVMRIFLGLFTFLAGGVAINAVMIHLWMRGSISTGEIAQIFNTTWNITMILWVAGTAIPGLFQSIGIAKQALTLMHHPKDVIDIPKATPLKVSTGEIIFDKVSFNYVGKKLFQNKDLHIKGGEKVGLVGYSGAGKSTFINLILRFYPIDQGRILIDGQEISKVTLESLRKQVALIPQDPSLFHRSLIENIRYGRLDASDREVLEAANLAHCDEFIAKMPQGYHTLVGERGTKLSGGERQRIAIARAILSNAPILILDEATSALDSLTENYIQESLQELMDKRTAIVIAHRLSTLARMDRILVFDQGKIVEEGSHAELLELGGHYAQMWEMQAGGFLPDNEDDEEE